MADDLWKIARQFSKAYPIMDDLHRRRQKGQKAAAILREALNGEKIRYILDVGCSNALFLDVVKEELQADFGLGLDLDTAVLPLPSKSRISMVADALSLPVRDSCVDLVLCNHTYEHVSDPEILFQEIQRVLKTGGIVYFGAMNSTWPIEPHFNLPFIHWLPKTWTKPVMRLFGYQFGYLEKPLSHKELRLLTQSFDLNDFTLKVLRNPQQYQARDIIHPRLSVVAYFLAKSFYRLLPGYLWVLRKRS